PLRDGDGAPHHDRHPVRLERRRIVEGPRVHEGSTVPGRGRDREVARAQARVPGAHSDERSRTMIYEIRTYTLNPGSVAEAEKRFGEAYEYRKKYSELTGFFHTEIGPLNQIVHIWGYPSLEARTRVRADAAKESAWPPKIQEFITAMQSEIVVPFPGSPEPTPGTIGPVFEYRYYTVRAGQMPGIQQR